MFMFLVAQFSTWVLLTRRLIFVAGICPLLLTKFAFFHCDSYVAAEICEPDMYFAIRSDADFVEP